MRNLPDLGMVAREFRIPGEFAGATPMGNGHIHDSYRVTFREKDQCAEYVLQRINTHVFSRPSLLMDNIERITTHLQTQAQELPDGDRRSLRLIRASSGKTFIVDANGSAWRMFRFIRGALSLESVNAAQARQVANAIGRFQLQLSTLPAPRLHDTIPDFHNTPLRFTALERAIAENPAGRRSSAAEEIQFAMQRKQLSFLLAEANLPERIVHNDPKSNNVLLDESTGQALCVIDLDTVMPGLAAHDFGDMVRSMTSPAPEDEKDLTRVHMRFDIYEALLDGYVSAAVAMLTEQEIRSLPDGGKVITFENGLRFLTDYLAGDTYYKTNYPEQNLHRARTQFKLLQSIEEQQESMQKALCAYI